MAINVQEGRLPENDSELAISTRINEKFKTNYKIGDTITLNVGELNECRFCFIGFGQYQTI